MISSSNLRGIICMVLSGITFVSCDSFLKLMLLEGVPPLQSLVLRGISATFWCFILVFATGNLGKLKWAFHPWVTVRSLLEVVAVCCFIVALAKVPLADLTAIYQLAPLIVLAVAAFLWGEHVGPLRWLLIALAMLGALLVAQPGQAGASPFALLGFVTALGSAARDICTRKVPADVPGPINTIAVVVMVMLASFVLSSLFETRVAVTRSVMLYALASGFFVMLGHLFVFLSFRMASARSVAPFYYSFTVTAVVFGMAFFSEIPNLLKLVGIALILACGLGVLALENRKDVKS
jgi:drug/metabolite transporter (DMT)-like permease